MKKYTVYFEIFGKKMKVVKFAKTKQEAELAVKNSIIFHKTVNEIEHDETVTKLRSMFGF